MKYGCGKLDYISFFICKVCKKLKIVEIIDKLIYPIIRNKRCKSIDYRQVLSEISEKPFGKSIVNRKEEWNACEKYDLQIIIPVYNGEKYLNNCIKSLINQRTSFLWHAVIVNDGSVDKTKCILEEYMNDGRFDILNCINQGAAKARNIGLDLTEAKYVMFLDADDLLMDDAIESLMINALRENADIIEGEYYDCKNGKISKSKHSYLGVVNNPIEEMRGFPWGKVIKAELFRHIEYPEGYWYEDSIISFLIYTQSKKAFAIDNIVYQYNRNPLGASYMAAGKAKSIDTVYIVAEMLDAAKELGVDLIRLYDLFLGHVSLSGSRTALLNRIIRQSGFLYFCEMKKIYFKDVHTNQKKNRIIEEALEKNNFLLYDWKTRIW